MLNSINADFYRLFHSKGFYITQILLVVLVTGAMVSQQTITLMNMSKTNASPAGHNPLWTGVDAVLNFGSISIFLIYFSLSIFIITIGYDLSHEMLKNVVTAGISRERFFISKYFVFLIVTMFQFIIYYGVVFILSSAMNGVGNFSLGFLKLFFGGVGLQFLLLHAAFAIGFCILYFTFSTVWPVLGIIVIPVIINIVSTLIPHMEWLYLFAFSNELSNVMTPQSSEEIFKIILSAFSVIFVLLGISFYHFKKKEL